MTVIEKTVPVGEPHQESLFRLKEIASEVASQHPWLQIMTEDKLVEIALQELQKQTQKRQYSLEHTHPSFAGAGYLSNEAFVSHSAYNIALLIKTGKLAEYLQEQNFPAEVAIVMFRSAVAVDLYREDMALASFRVHLPGLFERSKMEASIVQTNRLSGLAAQLDNEILVPWFESRNQKL